MTEARGPWTLRPVFAVLGSDSAVFFNIDACAVLVGYIWNGGGGDRVDVGPCGASAKLSGGDCEESILERSAHD